MCDVDYPARFENEAEAAPKLAAQSVDWEPIVERWSADPEPHISLAVEFDSNYRWTWEVRDTALPTTKRRVAYGYALGPDEAKLAAVTAWRGYKSESLCANSSG